MVMSVPEGASSETTPIRYVRGAVHQLPDRSHRARLPVVPKAFRDRFNLVPGTEVEVEASGDGVTLRSVGAEPSPRLGCRLMRTLFDTLVLVPALVDQLGNHRAAFHALHRCTDGDDRGYCSTHALAECAP